MITKVGAQTVKERLIEAGARPEAVKGVNRRTLLTKIHEEILDPQTPQSQIFLQALERDLGRGISADVAYGEGNTVGTLLDDP